MHLPTTIYLNIVHVLICSSLVFGLQSCLDEKHNPVDWFVIYKIPKLKENTNPLVQKGVGYAYITSENKQDWILSEKSINDADSMPGITLGSLYNVSLNQNDKLYIFYNDQPPNGPVQETGGHTKGVVVAEQSGGYWLVHSVPHYPPPPRTQTYSYPDTGLKNGQSFLCVSTSADQMSVVGNLLMYNYPHVFTDNVPTALATQYSALAKAAAGTDVHTPPWYHSDPLVSMKGTTFQAFAKSPKFAKDLYSDWVADVLQASLLVETWPNGPGRLKSSCHQTYRVENVDEINVAVIKSPFSAHKDHSKWAISETKENPWVCIGDINRAESQEERGGGTVCLKDPVLWQAYFSSITGVESCPIHHHNDPHHVVLV